VQVGSPKKPGKPNEPEKPKPGTEGKKPALAGTVKALSDDGKTFTLTTPPKQKGGEPATIEIRLGDETKITNGKEETKLAVGQKVVVWLVKGSENVAKMVQVGSGKKPGKPNEPEKPKPDKGAKKPALSGTVKALSADGKTLTLTVPPKKKGGEPTTIDVRIGDETKITTGKEDTKLAVGQFVAVWLVKGSENVAERVQVGSPKKPGKPNAPEKPKPGAEGKNPTLFGKVKALAADGKSLTLEMLNKKTGETTTIDIRIGDEAKITNGKEETKLAVGQVVAVWLMKGSENVAKMVQVGPAKKPGKPNEPAKKKPDLDGKKPTTDDKPAKPPKEKKPPRPVRDPAPTAAVIDAEVDRHLAAAKIPVSALTDDAAFLRRVSLDLTGRIPTHSRTLAFLESKEPDKRRKLIDELLDSPAYGKHLATVWRNLIVPANLGLTKGQPRDTFSGWLAEQFNDDRGWDAIVRDMLLAEGPINNTPQSTFLMSNGENFQPKANIVAGSVARLFWGINLRCAECHNHPFADWKQSDFWGTAAFFGKLQFTGFKGGGSPVLTESTAVPVSFKGKKGNPGAPVTRGSAIQIPAEAGRAAGRLVRARFLHGEEPALDENEPFRPRFAAWATAADNPWFARAAVNRMWAHFFGRGLIHPLDALDTGTPSHPELLRRLSAEFVASEFDLKHLARCIVSSNAYQRSSEPAPGNEADTSAFSHMAVKVLSPEVVFDSLDVVYTVDKTFFPKKGSVKGSKGAAISEKSREQFARFFRLGEGSDPTEHTQGIPQLLRLMNGPLLNAGAPFIDKLCDAEVSPTEALTTLYLTALSRRPRESEIKLLSGYLSRRKDAREGYNGVLWILLNSSEFALNR
jgi:hypothetical protein